MQTKQDFCTGTWLAQWRSCGRFPWIETVHCLGFLTDFFVFAVPTLIPSMNHYQFGWPFVRVTQIHQVLQGFYFLYCLICDIILMHPSNQSAMVFQARFEKLTKHRDRLFFLLATQGSLIGIGFWFLVAPFAVHLGSEIPPREIILAIMQHGIPFFFVLADAALLYHESRNKWIELGITTSFGILYFLWNRICYWVNGGFPYEIQYYFQPWYIGLPAYTGLILLQALGWWVLQKFNTRIWRSRLCSVVDASAGYELVATNM